MFISVFNTELFYIQFIVNEALISYLFKLTES